MSEALEKRVEELTEQLEEQRALLERIEPLLRALLKRAPARHHAPPPKKRPPSESVLSDEEKDRIRKRMLRKG